VDALTWLRLMSGIPQDPSVQPTAVQRRTLIQRDALILGVYLQLLDAHEPGLTPGQTALRIAEARHRE
jgi:hypothetical protein